MIQNLRDLGGIETFAGKIIKSGCLIRSANLSKAEEPELDGITTIIDLRTKEERNQAPDVVYGRTYLKLPVFEEMTAGISHERGAEQNGIPDMRVLYRDLITEHSDAFAKILQSIMNHDFSSGAVLWHCTEGKDRCGLTTALILEMLGVERDIIMEDYLKTNEINLPKAKQIRRRVAELRGEAFAESVYKAFIADSSYLEAAWEAMGDYYFETMGISENEIARFRSLIL